MNIQHLVFFGVFFTIHSSINFYIGIRGWQAFGRFLPHGWGIIYWTVFIVLAVSFFAGRFAESFLPATLGSILTIVGSYWLGVMNFLFLILVLVDSARLFDRWFGFIPSPLKQRPELAGLAVVLLVTGIVAYGAWNSRHPRLVHYDIAIPKSAGNLNELHMVVVSDIHLGKIIHNGRLLSLVRQVNKLEPDLVLLPGDTIEESINTFVDQNMSDSLSMLESKYGSFAVFGNHDPEEAYRILQGAGITVLRDEHRLIDGSFYIVGRDYGERFWGAGRKELVSVMAGVERSLPVLLIDHQPANLKEGQSQGVDLQVSGHTHLGQIFPFNLLTGRIYETDWGYLRKGDFQLIVSCGFGTWGPPLRVGNVPEIVDIDIRFTGPGQATDINEPVMQTMGRL